MSLPETPSQAKFADREYSLTIRDVGGSDTRFQRLRSLLKAMLRAYGYRCIIIKPEVSDE